MDAKEPVKGRTVFSPSRRYVIEEKLGEGVNGKVFAVKDENGSRFALKWYKPCKREEKALLHSNAKREFDIGQAFDHSRFIQTIEHFRIDDDQYLIMELVTGKQVASLKKQELSFEESLVASLRMIDSIAYAMQQQWIFDDLDAKNVMLTEDKEIKFVDLASFICFDEIKPPFNASYTRLLSRATDVCIELLNKTNLSREDKIEKRLAIKQLVWNCIEDNNENAFIGVDHYFLKLSELLKSFL